MTLWLVEAITSVRVGDGTAVGLVDLPLAREVPTSWPFLAGSGLKGALRASVRWRQGDETPFGELEARGSLVIQDGVLLALPVRSAAGGPALLTCPLALARLARVWMGGPPIPSVPAGVVVGPEWLQLDLRSGMDHNTATAGLEDLDLIWSQENGTELPAWRERLAERVGEDAVRHLCFVNDDLFAHAAAAWTEVQHRNAMGDDGVVADQALFTVERCPPGTLWWTIAAGLDQVLGPDSIVRLGGHRGGGSGRVVFFPLEGS